MLKLVSYVKDLIQVVIFVKSPTPWKYRANETLGCQSHHMTAHAICTGKFHRLSCNERTLLGEDEEFQHVTVHCKILTFIQFYIIQNKTFLLENFC